MLVAVHCSQTSAFCMASGACRSIWASLVVSLGCNARRPAWQCLLPMQEVAKLLAEYIMYPYRNTKYCKYACRRPTCRRSLKRIIVSQRLPTARASLLTHVSQKISIIMPKLNEISDKKGNFTGICKRFYYLDTLRESHRRSFGMCVHVSGFQIGS